MSIATPAAVRIGTAGWSYPHWNGLVYPKTPWPGFHSLEVIAKHLDTVEINSSFYQQLKPEVGRLWMRKVEANPDFLFTAKLHQRFTHARVLDDAEIAGFKAGLAPFLKARKLGAVLMQFPWSFRFTAENREFFIRLRRAFHEYPLVAEMRHSSWMREEALGTFLDYRVGFCNIDQPAYTSAMPPTEFLTSQVAYVRLHGRNPKNSAGGPLSGRKRVQAPCGPASTTICTRKRNWPSGLSISSTSRVSRSSDVRHFQQRPGRQRAWSTRSSCGRNSPEYVESLPRNCGAAIRGGKAGALWPAQRGAAVAVRRLASAAGGAVKLAGAAARRGEARRRLRPESRRDPGAA